MAHFALAQCASQIKLVNPQLKLMVKDNPCFSVTQTMESVIGCMLS